MLTNLINTQSSAPLPILFISETRLGERTFSDTAHLHPSLIPNLSLYETIDCQLLRVFLGKHFPKLRTPRQDFSGYQTFKIWFTNNKAALDPKLTTTSPSKQKIKPKSPPTLLEKECENRDLCEILYQELCLLAPYGKYKSGDHINISGSDSHFNINLHSKLKSQIEKILARYRQWMAENNKLDLAVFDLTSLRTTPEHLTPNQQRYDYVVWNSRQTLSPNIKNMLDDIAYNVINLPPREQEKATSNLTPSYVTDSVVTSKLESDADEDTSTIIDDIANWGDHAQALIDDISSRDTATLDRCDQQLLTQPEVISAMLSTDAGKSALRKVLITEPYHAETIFSGSRLPIETFVSIVNFITHTDLSTAISLHFTIMQTTMKVFDSIINLYLTIKKNSAEASPIRGAIILIATEDHLKAGSTLALLCQPENHKTFLNLLRLRLTKGLGHYWNIIKNGFGKITSKNKGTSLLCHLLKTIDGIAVLNQFINADTSAKIRIRLEENSREFLSHTFSTRVVTLPVEPYECSILPFSDLLNASKLPEIMPHSANTSDLTTEADTVIKAITFLARNAFINENEWSEYMRALYSSIIIYLANYIKSFTTNYWEEMEPGFPWEDLLALVTQCKMNLNNNKSQEAADALFQITQFHAMQNLLDEKKLVKLQENITSAENYGKIFFETSIDYLLQQNMSYLEDFIDKIIHPNHYLVFTSLITHINIMSSKEEEFISKLLNFLGNHLQQTFSTKSIAKNTNMYRKILSVFSEKQQTIHAQKPNSILKTIILDLVNFLMNNLLNNSYNDCLLYQEALSVVQATEITEKELTKIFTVFCDIHAKILIPSIMLNNKRMALNMYYTLMAIILEMEEFHERYKYAIATYSMAKEYYLKSPTLKNNTDSDWHAGMHLYAWMMNVSELAMAGKNQKILSPDFFAEVLQLSRQHAADDHWTHNQKNRIFCVYLDFLRNAMQYLRKNPTTSLPELFWEELKALFDQKKFGYSEENNLIIDKISLVIDMLASDLPSHTVKAEPLLSEIYTLREKLDDPNNDFGGTLIISEHPSTLFGMHRDHEVATNRGSYYATGQLPNVDGHSISAIMTTS